MSGTKFNNIYLRSNLQSDGTIPEQGSYHESPDIFSNGTEPLLDFETVLADPENYKVQPADHSITTRDNYCYLRCRNNTENVITGAKAQLFYTQSAVVLWPENWKPMNVDVKQTTLNDFKDIQPGAIGVVERPFIWEKPPAPETKNHYCMIGRLETPASPNPIPDVKNPIEMAKIIQTNLMYTQKNIFDLNIGPGSDGSYTMIISAGAGISSGTNKYHLFFYSQDMDGWDVEITSSMRDSEGKKIGIERTRIEGSLDIYCGQYILEPGFLSLTSVYFYSNGKETGANPKTCVKLEYASGFDEMEYAKESGVLNMARSNYLKKVGKINQEGALISLGGFTAVIH